MLEELSKQEQLVVEGLTELKPQDLRMEKVAEEPELNGT